MVEARDVGHDGLLVRTGCAHDVCGEESRSGGGGEGRRGELRLLNGAQNDEETGSRTGVQLFTNTTSRVERKKTLGVSLQMC